MTCTYDQDTWEAILVIDGVRYTYQDVSPYHWGKFRRMLKRNFGRAMAYLRGFEFKKGKEA